MRIPVFARRSNPAIDRPILRKSLIYCAGQVASGLADWVDCLNPRKGIVAQEYLPSGKALPADTQQLGGVSGMAYLKFIPPKPAQETTVLRVRFIPALDRQISAAIAG